MNAVRTLVARSPTDGEFTPYCARGSSVFRAGRPIAYPARADLEIGGGYHAALDLGSDWFTVSSTPTVDVRATKLGQRPLGRRRPRTHRPRGRAPRHDAGHGADARLPDTRALQGRRLEAERSACRDRRRAVDPSVPRLFGRGRGRAASGAPGRTARPADSGVMARRRFDTAPPGDVPPGGATCSTCRPARGAAVWMEMYRGGWIEDPTKCLGCEPIHT